MKNFSLLMALCLLTLSPVSFAAGPGSGSLVKYNVPIGQCTASSISVKWKLDSLMGEPTVSGSYQWAGASNCRLPSSTTIWLEVKSSDGGLGYVYLSPVIPEANSGYGYNTTGSPNWNSTLCSFKGTEKLDCLDRASAVAIWKTGYVSGFFVAWDGETSNVQQGSGGGGVDTLSNRDKIEIIFDEIENAYPAYLYPIANTEVSESGDEYYFRFYDSAVGAVAISMNDPEIWYYIADWNYFATLEEANEILCAGGCIEQYGGTTTGTDLGAGTESVMTWEVSDQCNDGYTIEYKFWNRSDNNESYWGDYTTSGYDRVDTNSLSCIVGEQICLGAKTGNQYWGVGFDEGNEGCESCCATCSVDESTYSYNASCS
ncbi:MAG: hypothetical protein GQ582_09760 [Methyloprofundus sp.]|nr:hypothetical protein [Methyloprofundus sp.]